jgi:hypothetical protein
VQDAERAAWLMRNRDGSGDLRARLSPACLAVWETVLEPLLHHPSTGEACPDRRREPQKLHDALQEAGRRLLAAGELPATAGIETTLLITMTLDQLETRAGQATTCHGGTLSVRQALRLATAARVLPVILDQDLGILGYGRGRRLASPGQRLALFARDRGCTFPGCRRTAAQSQVHHLTDWARHGDTDLDNLALACAYHNNEAPRQQWHAQLINGVTHWIPPELIDPDRKPQRNRIHRD